MSQREEIIAIAKGQVGYKEYANNNNIFGVWYGMNNQPWCDIFVSWCADQVGLQDIIPKNAYVPDRMAYYKKLNSFYKRGTYTPKQGDLVLFDFNLNGTPDHIGFVYEVKGSTLTTIEGNTTKNGESSNGDGVYQKSRNINSSIILGYCVPAYEEEEQMEIKTVGVKNLDNGKIIEVEAINVAGSNYIKLRDVEKLFPVIIDWNGKNPTIGLNYKQ